VLVGGQALAQHLEHRLAPRRRHVRLPVGGHEALDAALAQPVRERVPALEAGVLALWRVGRRHEHQAGDAVAVVECQPDDRVGAHRRSGQHGALDSARVEHGEQVGGEQVVAVVAGAGRGTGAPVAAGVVGDDAVSAPLERARAHHDVAARSREAVQEHDRDAFPGLLAGQLDARARDDELGHAR
jgi:hypothetical protein